ncbi:hypothetical protein D9M69_518640 [compost metagenome]
MIARHHDATDQAAEQRNGADHQHPFHTLAEVLEQGINQNPAQGTEEKQQVAQLIHGKHRTAPGRTHAMTRQQSHDRQRPATAAGRGAVGEFGGHHHAEAPEPADLVALIPQQ